MKKNNEFNVVMVGVCLPILVMSGCAVHSISPPGWSPSISKVQQDAFGAWMALKYDSGDQKHMKSASGELIAVHDEQVYLMGADDGVTIISTDSIISLKIQIFKPKDTIVPIALLGTLSTLSHGFFIIFSLPIWLITGIASSSGEARSGYSEYEHLRIHKNSYIWIEIRKFARFPQGIPEGLELESLRPKVLKEYKKQ